MPQVAPGTTAAAAGCYLSMVPTDRHGHGGSRGALAGAGLGDLRRDQDRPSRSDSVDILNEALGPLLLALGFPIEPYTADGRWIVTGPRKAG